MPIKDARIPVLVGSNGVSMFSSKRPGGEKREDKQGGKRKLQSELNSDKDEGYGYVFWP